MNVVPTSVIFDGVYQAYITGYTLYPAAFYGVLNVNTFDYSNQLRNYDVGSSSFYVARQHYYAASTIDIYVFGCFQYNRLGFSRHYYYNNALS